MKDKKGAPIFLGDRVSFVNGDVGQVVCVIDADEYLDGYPKDQWSYLKEGIMVKTDRGALVHLFDGNLLERLVSGRV